MTDVLIFGDTIRSPELRHEVPIGIGDPFLYAEHGGARYVVANGLELPRLLELPGLEVLTEERFGRDALVAQRLRTDEVQLEVALRVCRELGITSARVPATFPLELADRLRAAGIELTPDSRFFVERRRRKNEAELAGIRRAQAVTQRAMVELRDMLRLAEPRNGSVFVEGEPLTSELLRAVVDSTFAAGGVMADDVVVSHGPQSAVGHEAGSGPIAPGEPIVVDLFPRDRESACYADMTRTFVVGTPSEELREYQRLCLEALRRSTEATRPGVTGRALFDLTCDIFERNGYRTQRTKQPGEVLAEGFFHSLGHGVGLEVHEEPGLSRLGHDELVAGDVVALEPGLYRSGFGGCRLEDLVLVTADGAEVLADFPYDLEP